MHNNERTISTPYGDLMDSMSATPLYDNTSYGQGASPSNIHTIPAQGTWNGRPVMLCTSNPPIQHLLFFPTHEDSPSMTWSFPDRDRLEKFFLLTYGGEFVWK
jgi:hypothetical protein